MGDILDIVTRLTYELNNKGLQDAANLLGSQIKQLQTLQAEEKKLAAQRSPEAVAKNKQAQAALTQEINKGITANKQLIATMNQEVGVLGKMGDRIRDLKRYREDAHKSEIRGINEEIAALERQRKATLETGSTGSFLGGLMGNKSLPTQLGQGLLYGLGIGSGFGIVTRVVSELIDLFGKLGAEIFNTVDHQKEMQASAEAMAGALKSEAEELGKLLQLFSTIDDEINTKGLQRQLELIKARGVVTGEVFKHEEEVFKGEQALRESQQGDLENLGKAYQDVADIAKNVSNSVDAGTFQKYFPATVSIADDKNLSNNEKIEKIFEQEGKLRDIPQPLLDKMRLSIEGAKSGNEIKRGLKRALDEISLLELENQQNIEDKKTEIKASADARNAEIAERQYQLERALGIKSRNDSAEIAQQVLQDMQELDRVEIDRIKEKNKRKITLEQQAVNDEITLSAKAGSLTQKALDFYEKQKYDIRVKYDLLTEKEIQQYNINRVRQQVEIAAKENEMQVANLSKQLGIQTQIGEDTLGTREELAQAQTRVELNSAYKRYYDLYQTAYKAGNDTAQLTDEYEKEIELILLQGNRRGVELLEQYYNDRLRIIKLQGAEEEQAIEGNALAQESTYEDAYNDGLISLRKYHRRRREIEYQAHLDKLQQDKRNLEKELQEARENERLILSNPNASDLDKRNAGNRVTGVQNRLGRVNQQITDTAGTPSRGAQAIFGDTSFIKDTEERRRAEIEKSIEAYSQLTAAAVNGFNTIYEAQANLLDREIAIREKRLDVALKLAERGNTEILKQEQDRLNEALRARQQVAAKQMQINALLAVSESVVAIAHAAAQSGTGAIVVVPAVIAALLAGFAAVKAATQEASPLGFAEGVENFDGKGTGTSDSNLVRISKGESVLTAKATQAYAGIPTAMNNGTFRFADIPGGKQVGMNLDATNKKLDRIANRLENLEVKAENKMDANGVSQMISAYEGKIKTKWSNA